MPVYCYRCKECNKDFEIKHSMFYENQTCIFCESSKIFKLPSIMKKQNNNFENKPGKIVNNFIEETRKEINKDKKELKTREL
tara:strand:- start:140 stop:385 length:246 start_codon:yes stop_codon:yes gene_type:complete